MRKHLEYDLLHELFEYKNGELYWKVDRPHRFDKGKIAGHVTSNGYRTVKINRIGYCVHKIVYIMTYGNCIEGFQIDHINGERSDNRFENLRLVTHVENCYNIKNVKGYSFHKHAKKYAASINVNKKRINLGSYEKEEDARNAYLNAKEKYHIIPDRKIDITAINMYN
tara:strand:- start:1705 stop:2208 length:504 start_codon:yes stop_codon:yes gene_type:complete